MELRPSLSYKKETSRKTHDECYVSIFKNKTKEYIRPSRLNIFFLFEITQRLGSLMSGETMRTGYCQRIF